MSAETEKAVATVVPGGRRAVIEEVRRDDPALAAALRLEFVELDA